MFFESDNKLDFLDWFVLHLLTATYSNTLTPNTAPGVFWCRAIIGQNTVQPTPLCVA